MVNASKTSFQESAINAGKSGVNVTRWYKKGGAGVRLSP